MYFDRNAMQSAAKWRGSGGMHRRSSPHRENWAAWVSPQAIPLASGACRTAGLRFGGVFLQPTYGNTLMGLAPARPPTPEDGYKIAYYPPLPSAVLEVVDSDTGEVVDHGETGRVRLTALTREFFVPGFLERDEGEREPPWGPYAWDGVSGVRPLRATPRRHHGRGLLTGKPRLFPRPAGQGNAGLRSASPARGGLDAEAARMDGTVFKLRRRPAR